MKPTESLSQEHKVILNVMDVAEREAAQMQKSGRVKAWTIEKIVDFFQNFTDKCHHAKEERYLFIKMEERGIPRVGGPLGQMLTEHGEGRRHLQAIAGTMPLIRDGNRDAARNAGTHLAAYVRLMRAHTRKEDLVLYPLGVKVFTPEDVVELNAGFAKVEREGIGKAAHEKYSALPGELTRE
jgi:hemerythrin-like domain-containing protein